MNTWSLKLVQLATLPALVVALTACDTPDGRGKAANAAGGPPEPDWHKVEVECAQACPVDYPHDKQAILQSIAAAKSATVGLLSTTKTHFDICDGTQPCELKVDIALGTKAPHVGQCVASMDYCGLCVTGTNRKIEVTWTLNPLSGLPADTKYKFDSKEGVKLHGAKGKDPKDPSKTLVHFEELGLVTGSSTQYRWQRGPDPTRGKVQYGKDHGHEPKVWQIDKGGNEKPCPFVDPPIINTAN